MSARDRYSIDIKCRGCGEVGLIGVSEDDYPFMRKLHRSVDYVNGNFTADMKNDFQVSAVCTKCKVETLWPDDKKKT